VEGRVISGGDLQIFYKKRERDVSFQNVPDVAKTSLEWQATQNKKPKE
jgi:hypothetical protein